MAPNIIPDNLISRLSELVNTKMGLHFPENRWKDLRRNMTGVAQDIARIHKIENNPVICIEWLLTTPLTKAHLDILAKHLTIGETYFFRDKSLFQALRQNIFPELIRLRQKKKCIRIWSAGCSSGEEPYSLAILVDQMIPAHGKDWKVAILATDINATCLEKAEKGVYTKWSFRNTPARTMEKYFKKRDEKYFEISPALKKMVRFSQLNLVENTYPSEFGHIWDMDIIFCRNVLMYFKPEVREEIIGRFFQSLTDRGLLIFSPSESPCVRHSGLCPFYLPGTTFYRKIEAESNVKPEPVKPVKTDSQPPYLKALTLANIGRLEEAETFCRQAIQQEKLRSEHHYLLATIYHEQNRLRESVKSLTHTIYLDPEFVMAYFWLGNLRQKQGRLTEADKHFRNTRSLLLDMKAEDILPHSEGMAAGNLLKMVQSMISKMA